METSVVRRRKRSASAERIKNAYNGANNVEVEVIEAVGTASVRLLSRQYGGRVAAEQL